MTTATRELLFDKDIAIAHGATLHVTREVDGEDEEIRGRCREAFGDWRDDNADDMSTSSPSNADVETAVSEALGFRVGITADGIQWVGDDDTLTIEFERVGPRAFATVKPEPSERDQLLDRISRQARIVQNARNEADAARQDATEADKHWKKESKELMNLCLALDEKHPLFDGRNGEAPKAAPPPPDDSWKKTPIAELGLTESVVAKLHEAVIDTIGQLCDHKNQEFPPKIAGIGNGTWDKIDDAFEQWFRDHPEHCRQKPDPTASAPALDAEFPADPDAAAAESDLDSQEGE